VTVWGSSARFLQLLYRRFLLGDMNAAVALVQQLSPLLHPGYLNLDPRVDWWSDEAFGCFLRRFGEDRRTNAHRRWMLYQLLRLTAPVDGDTAECGVFRGSSSWLICQSNLGTGKTHHLFDSFSGLSEPSLEDGSYWQAGMLSVSEDEVRHNLRDCVNQVFYPGWIPDRFDEVDAHHFSFVHIDVDLAQPTIDSVRFFYPRLAPGGILLCDDYGQTTSPGVTHCVDQYFVDRPEKAIALPTGGAFMIKGLKCAAPIVLSRESDPGTDGI